MGWLLINICFPIVAPLAMYLVFVCIPLPRRPRKRLNPILTVKDGQLCWVAIGFCASALHEISGVVGFDWLNGGLILILVLSSLLACGGALFQTTIHRAGDGAWARHYRCFIGSAFLTACAGSLFAVAHFSK